jgi:hypothetical protein
VRIHLAGEHALELERLDPARELLRVRDDRVRGALVVFGDRELEQLAGLDDAGLQPLELVDDLRETRALAPELLRALRVVPDVRVLELAGDFLEPFALGIDVKGTP